MQHALLRPLPTSLSRTTQAPWCAFVGSLTADNLEDAYRNLQAESMCGVLAEQLAANLLVRHTSASVGDILVTEEGLGFMVDQVGFKSLKLESSAARAEYALHLMSMRLERTTGWRALFLENTGATAAVLAERLRDDTLGLVYHARHPFH